MLILANDAGWGGWGRALVDIRGPIWTSHVKLSGRTWRWDAMREELADLDARIRAIPGLQDGATIERPPFRVAVETAPAVYSGRGRSSRGNQAATGQGMGQIQGALLAWGTRPGIWLYPWDIEVSEWRSHFGIRNRRGRADYKWTAIAVCSREGWGRHLLAYEDPGPEADHGARGDVAEAILQGMYAVKNPGKAPTGPVRSAIWNPPKVGAANPRHWTEEPETAET